MSYNPTNKTGEVIPLQYTDFLQFIPTVGAGIVMGFEQIIKLFPQAFKTESQLIAQKMTSSGGVSFVTSKPLGKQWYDIFKPSGTFTTITKKPVIPNAISSSLKGISKNVAIGSGTILGTTGLLSLTQGGQNLVTTTGESIGNITNLGKSVNDLFAKNPILPIGLLILGGLIVVSVIKK